MWESTRKIYKRTLQTQKAKPNEWAGKEVRLYHSKLGVFLPIMLRSRDLWAPKEIQNEDNVQNISWIFLAKTSTNTVFITFSIRKIEFLAENNCIWIVRMVNILTERHLTFMNKSFFLKMGPEVLN